MSASIASSLTPKLAPEEQVEIKEGIGDDASICLTPQEDKRLLHKIDRCLLPVMALTYLFQFLDKSALGFTAIMGLREDLSLSGLDFSWASGIYYFGCLIASYPAGVLMVRLPVAKVISASVLAWGLVLILTAVCFSAAGLLANRFFLGVTEAAVAPGLGIIISMWYKRSEQPLRHGAWYLGNTLAGITGGLFAFAIGHIQTIAPWKAVFLIFGGLTIAWGLCLIRALPDVPTKAWFLSEKDRTKAVARVSDNLTGIKSDEFKWYQCREAFLDVKLWLLFLIQLSANIGNGGVHSFGSIIINGLGFTVLNTLLVQMIAYAFQGLLVIVATASTTYIPNIRTYVMMLNLAISLAGTIMIRQVDPDQVWARFFGYCLCMGYSANMPVILSMSSANFGGFTKKTTANSMLFIAYSVANIVGPQLFFAREAPTYKSGFLALAVCFSVAIMGCLILRLYLVRENRRRDAAGSFDACDTSNELDVNALDKTDQEIRQFRYLY